MQAFDNNMTGILFRNDKTKPSQPDYKGQCEIEGKKFWVSGWIKEGRNGKFMSLSFQYQDKERQDGLQDVPF